MTSIIRRTLVLREAWAISSHFSPFRYLSCDIAEHPHPSVNKYSERTHTCGQVSSKDVGKHVSLYGWIKYSRFGNKLITLRDSYGMVQCVVGKNDILQSLRQSSLHLESVIKVTGIVKKRSEKLTNKSLLNGDIEVEVEDVQILSSADKNMPILSRDQDKDISLENRLKYRYLDLRSSLMQEALRLRSKVCHIFRDKLYELEFVECETPTLFNRTPGGANEFIVPTQMPEKFYSLVQSPQQLKQLLMIGGLDRYFQFSRCYRDESTRSDRQPEFTQIDLEISFTNQSLVMDLIDDLMYHLLTNITDDPRLTELYTSSFDGSRRIPRIPHDYAIEKYGTDKPDTRFEWLLENDCDGGLFFDTTLNSIDQAIIDETLHEASKPTGFDLNKIIITDQDNLNKRIKTTDNSRESRQFLGYVRHRLANNISKLNPNLGVYQREFQLLWVTGFPLFTDDGSGRFKPNHHPFTAPTPESMEFVYSDPSRVVGQHYDLVLNGTEVAGGSIRIHDAELQEKILVDILGVQKSKFGYFIEALKSGCPPHGGIALGLDRLMAVLMHKESIRDVMAFPKSTTGRDLMTGCPDEIGSDIKKLYHIKQ